MTRDPARVASRQLPPELAVLAGQHYLVWLPVRRPAGALGPIDHDVRARALRPAGHFTRQRHLRAATSGDHFWLVRGGGPGLDSPALDALVIVRRVKADQAGIWFEAERGSRWFGWNDLSDRLARMAFVGERGATRLDMARPIGLQLQTTRRLSQESGRNLLIVAAELAARPQLFLSYRWREARRFALHVTGLAARVGFAPWIDRWSAPRRLAQGVDIASEHHLAGLLADAVSASAASAILRTPSYGREGWTRLEHQLLRDRDQPNLELRPEASEDEIQRALEALLAEVSIRRGGLAADIA